MSNVIKFLETMGQDSQLRHGGEQATALELDRTDISADLKAAILSGDRTQMETLLGARTNVVCGIFPGKEDDDEKREPSPDDDEIGMHSNISSVASAS